MENIASFDEIPELPGYERTLAIVRGLSEGWLRRCPDGPNPQVLIRRAKHLTAVEDAKLLRERSLQRYNPTARDILSPTPQSETHLFGPGPTYFDND